jgi:hypothetical protein
MESFEQRIAENSVAKIVALIEKEPYLMELFKVDFLLQTLGVFGLKPNEIPVSDWQLRK